MIRIWKRFRTSLLALPLAAGGTLAPACETALLLAMDVSNSVDPREYRIQTEGLAAALADPAIAETLVQGRSAVAVLQWSGRGMQAMAIPWTRIAGPTDVAALAEAARAMPRAFVGGNTAIGEALAVGTTRFGAVGDCHRWILDISGDGPENAGTALATASRAAERRGITVNGLAIESLGRAITSYYERVLITPDGFVETAKGFTDFARAIRAKILREISQVTG